MAARERFSSQAAPEVLAATRQIARTDGRRLQAVPEDAMTGYIEARRRRSVRPGVMAHYRESVERNRLPAELLAK